MDLHPSPLECGQEIVTLFPQVEEYGRSDCDMKDILASFSLSESLALWEAICHVVGTLKQPVGRPTW